MRQQIDSVTTEPAVSDNPEFVTKPVVAQRLSKTVRTVEVWMKAGLIPHIKLGHSTLFHWPSVVEALKSRMQ